MFELSTLSIGFVAGLIIGWNLLPQPKWIRKIWSKIVGPAKESDTETTV